MAISISAPSLPPPAAIAVTPEIRLAYVLRHFRLAYDDVPDITVGYAGARPTITIADGARDFFADGRPYPSAPSYREWAGQRVPFFFDAQPDVALLTLTDGRATIAADLISGAFYLLSGWQEYFSEARDRHGRFPYTASVQQQYDFVALPVVNYYFDVLRTAVEHVAGWPLRPRRWAGTAPFAAFITHDIDALRSGWKAPAKAALQQKQLLKFGQLAWQHFSQPDAWDNLEAVAAAGARYGARSTFFILPEHRPGADGTPNADYPLAPALIRRLVKLRSQGSEMSMHGSIGTATDAAHLARERALLPPNPAGLRFHYLRWEPRITPPLVAAAGFRYDSTLGFAEHFGFRHSYCLPFYPFNFATGTEHGFLEIPLNVMDATLHHPNYLQLRAEEILPALQPMFAEIEKFGGVATVPGPRQFAEIMEHLRQHGAAFFTGSQIVAEL